MNAIVVTRPELIAIDFDGTLLRSDRTISERTVMAVKAADQAGIRVIVVTGRPPRWLTPIADLLEGRGVAIAANGALVVDLESGRVLDSRHLTVDDATEVIIKLRSAFSDVWFGVERPNGFAHERGYPRGIRNSEKVPGVEFAEHIEELLSEPPVKILARVPDRSIDDAAAAAIDALDGIASVYFSSTDLLEIAPAGVSKASTLEEVAARWGIDAPQVAAFGDMPNDIPMLEWAGQSVAVANAHPAVRAVVDLVTASNDDDGVARVIERFVDAPV